jgi:hypothetical protein
VYTYLLRPGINLGYETAKSSVVLNYTLNLYDYDDQDDLLAGWQPADREDYTGHTLGLKFKTRPNERFTFGLDESYIKTRDPASSDNLSNAIDRDKYYINRFTPKAFYNFSKKLSAGIRYRLTNTDYNLATREDSTEKRPMFDLIYHINSKTSIDLEYQHWTRDYDLTTSDYTSDQVKLIFRKQFNYFALEAGGGTHDRDFDDPTLQDIDTVTFRAGLIGQNPPAPEQRPKSHMSLVGEKNFNDSGSQDSYFTSNRLIFSAGYLYKEKVPFGMLASYQDSDYERTTGITPVGTTELRSDDTYHFQGSIGYIFTDYLTFTAKAGYESRNSNIAGKDYDNSYVMATVDFMYNIGKR